MQKREAIKALSITVLLFTLTSLFIVPVLGTTDSDVETTGGTGWSLKAKVWGYYTTGDYYKEEHWGRKWNLWPIVFRSGYMEYYGKRDGQTKYSDTGPLFETITKYYTCDTVATRTYGKFSTWEWWEAWTPWAIVARP